MRHTRTRCRIPRSWFRMLSELPSRSGMIAGYAAMRGSGARVLSPLRPGPSRPWVERRGGRRGRRARVGRGRGWDLLRGDREGHVVTGVCVPGPYRPSEGTFVRGPMLGRFSAAQARPPYQGCHLIGDGKRTRGLLSSMYGRVFAPGMMRSVDGRARRLHKRSPEPVEAPDGEGISRLGVGRRFLERLAVDQRPRVAAVKILPQSALVSASGWRSKVRSPVETRA
jgi:hypothetical protein